MQHWKATIWELMINNLYIFMAEDKVLFIFFCIVYTEIMFMNEL